MEPIDEKALRELPDRELLIRTAVLVHDMHKDLPPRVAALEKWKDHVHWVGGTVASLLGAGLLNLHSLFHGMADKIGGKLGGHP